MLAYSGGQFVPADQAAIPLHDAGFMWGATVTDRVRTFDGRLFRVREHVQRFRESCRLARIRLEVPDDRIVEVSEHLVTSNREEYELAVIWLATPGRRSGFASGPDMRIPTFIAYTENLNPLNYRRLCAEGARLVSRPATLGADPRVKHRSRLPWWVVVQEVHDQDRHADPLFLDPETGSVLETPAANLLAVLDGTLVSPPAGRVLAGVSLAVVEELARGLHIPFAYRDLTLDDLAGASEVTLTNTSYCLAGVSSLDGRPIPFPGPILGRLLDAWAQLVGDDPRRMTVGR